MLSHNWLKRLKAQVAPVAPASPWLRLSGRHRRLGPVLVAAYFGVDVPALNWWDPALPVLSPLPGKIGIRRAS